MLHTFGFKEEGQTKKKVKKQNMKVTSTNKDKDLVSIEFAANYYGVCKKTVRNWISQGRLQGYELADRLIRLDYEEIRNLPIPINGTYRKGKINND